MSKRFTAFILAHGIITPERQQTPSTDTSSLHYTIHGEPLPRDTRLYSPKILGNAYYDRQGTDRFIPTVFYEYYTDGTRPDLDSFCLQKIAEYEKGHTEGMKHALEEMDTESGALFQIGNVPYTDRDRSIRKQFIEGITHKTNTEWCEHGYFIQQKRYQINRDNCILLFCENTNKNTQSRATEFLFENVIRINIQPFPKYYQITIKFTRTLMYTFEEINELLNSIINQTIMRLSRDSDDSRDWRAAAERDTSATDGTRPQRARTPEPMVPPEIVYYDFTCCTIRFPFEPELSGLNVHLLLASISPTPTLVYGTTRTDVDEDEKILRGMLSSSGSGGIRRPNDSDSDVEEIQGDSMSPAGSASPYRSTSLSVKSTIHLFVNVDSNLQTFISTVSVDGGGGAVSVSPGGHLQSQSPSEEVGGGSHRIHTHTRRLSRRHHSRHHPRVGKKVSLRNGRRRRLRRGTKVRSKRSIHKRKT